ncbi:glycoside hydrolase family 95-like protein [Rhizobium changzhiense]
MLAHSRSGEIRLLPALPQALSTGRVSGLRLRRGIELDMEWSEGTLQTARLKSTREQTVLLRSKAGEQTVALRAGDWTCHLVQSKEGQLPIKIHRLLCVTSEPAHLKPGGRPEVERLVRKVELPPHLRIILHLEQPARRSRSLMSTKCVFSTTDLPTRSGLTWAVVGSRVKAGDLLPGIGL